MTTVRWWLVRHAPVRGWDGRIYGCLDVPCDTGDAAAFASLAARLPTDPVLVESHLGRCRQTAAALAEAGARLPAPIVAPDLAEQDFGDWHNLPWTGIPDTGFWDAPTTNAPPGGESFAAMLQRVRRGIERLTADHRGRDIVAVVHAGTVRGALALALDLSPPAALRMAVDNLSLTRIDLTERGWRVVTVNARP